MNEVKNQKKYIVTLEITLDPSEVSDPYRWNYSYLLGKDAPSVEATLIDSYEACCEGYVEWITSDPETRYGDKFQPEWHDETCAKYEPIDEPEDDEDEATLLTEVVFGGEDPVARLGEIFSSIKR